MLYCFLGSTLTLDRGVKTSNCNRFRAWVVAIGVCQMITFNRWLKAAMVKAFAGKAEMPRTRHSSWIYSLSRDGVTKRSDVTVLEAASLYLSLPKVWSWNCFTRFDHVNRYVVSGIKCHFACLEAICVGTGTAHYTQVYIRKVRKQELCQEQFFSLFVVKKKFLTGFRFMTPRRLLVVKMIRVMHAVKFVINPWRLVCNVDGQ